MNLQRRVQLTWLVLYVVRFRRLCWLVLYVYPLVLLGYLMLPFIKRKTHHRVETFKRAVASWTARGESYLTECQAISLPGGQPTELRRTCLLATQSALLAERTHLQQTAADLISGRPVGSAAVLCFVFDAMQDNLCRFQRKYAVFKGIVSQMENSRTFYWDLLVWYVIPDAYSEELLGDLTEEYRLRSTAEGEVRALAWYRNQSIRTVVEHLWKKVERLAAIGSLVEFLRRLLR